MKSQQIPNAVGVDGCKAGWFYFELQENEYKYGVSGSFSKLIQNIPKSRKIYIDIPVGLPDKTNYPRLCDVMAKKMLGKKHSSVFYAPIREVLQSQNFIQANTLSKKLTGKGLSKQSFGIMKKIAEVDYVVQKDNDTRKRLREAHPELCFMSMNDGEPMQYNKKTHAGFKERINTLVKFRPDANNAITEARKNYKISDVGLDDIVDALVLAIMADQPENKLKSIPVNKKYDETGLVMEMIYLSL